MIVEKVVCNMCCLVTPQFIDFSAENEQVRQVTSYF